MSGHVQRRDRDEVERARSRGQLVGWVQGAGAVVLFGVVLSLIGWIPAVLVAAGVGYVAYRVLFGTGAPRP